VLRLIPHTHVAGAAAADIHDALCHEGVLGLVTTSPFGRSSPVHQTRRDEAFTVGSKGSQSQWES